MTAIEFDQLPALLRRKQVITLTGVSEDKYPEMMAAANGHVITLPGFKEKRVRKEFLRFLVVTEDTGTTGNQPKLQT